MILSFVRALISAFKARRELVPADELNRRHKPKDKKHRRGAKNLEETRSGLTSSNLVERCTSAE